MKTNKSRAWWISHIIASLIIPFVCMFLMSMNQNLSEYERDFFWFYFTILFGIPAFFLSLFLFFVLDLGLSKLWSDKLDVKTLGLALIISALLVPFIWANWVGASQISSPVLPWWTIPLSASLILLLWSSIEFALTKVAEHEAKKAKREKGL